MPEDSNPYPDGTDVYVRYPLPCQENRPRISWAMLPGVIVVRRGPGGYVVAVTDERVADFDEDGEPIYPIVFRSGDEIIRRPR